MSAPVVLLHSGGMSSRQWGRLAAALPDERAVHAPDFAGHGSRAGADGPDDPLAHDVAEVAGLLRGLASPADVVGHSYGGTVALLAARAAPGTVRSLALYEPVAFGVLHDPPDADGLADLARVCDTPAWEAPAGPDDGWFRTFVDYWSGAGAWEAMDEGGRDAFRRGGTTLVAGAHALVAERTPAAAYAEIGVPVLLVGGDRSPVSVARVADRLEAVLPDVRRETIAGAGHMGPLTHAAEVNALVGDFIAT